MKVILELDTKYIDQFQAMADQNHRSRKNFMETVLMNFLDGSPPTLERQKDPKIKVVNLTQEPPRTNYAVNTLSDKEKEVMIDRMLVLNQELANPPKNPLIGQSKWIAVRKQELKELQEKLNQ